jgi:hypothetical protein
MPRNKNSYSKIEVPRALTLIYIIAGVLLVTWRFMLSVTLPVRHLSRHWDLAWVGFDLGMLLAIALTVYFAQKRSWRVSLSAMSLFTFLVIDGWFDILTSKPGQQMNSAIWSAVLIEFPLAIISLRLAYRVMAGRMRRS